MIEGNSRGHEADERFNELNARRIGVTEWKVLLALAYDGPRNMYAISKKNKMKYPVVHRVTKELEKIEWIRVAEERRSEKNVEVKVYTLTSEGLLWLFVKIPKKIPVALIDPSQENACVFRKRLESAESTGLEDLKTQEDVYSHLFSSFDLNKIAEANATLFPLVFGKWGLYRKSDVAFVLSQAFPDAALTALLQYYYGDDRRESKFETLENLFVYESYRAAIETFSRGYATRPSKIREVYLNQILFMYKHNPQIQDIFDRVLSEMETTSTKTLILLKKIKSARARNT